MIDASSLAGVQVTNSFGSSHFAQICVARLALCDSNVQNT